MMIRNTVLSAWTTLPSFSAKIPFAILEFGFFFFQTPQYLLDCVPADKIIIPFYLSSCLYSTVVLTPTYTQAHCLLGVAC